MGEFGGMEKRLHPSGGWADLGGKRKGERLYPGGAWVDLGRRGEERWVNLEKGAIGLCPGREGVG